MERECGRAAASVHVLPIFTLLDLFFFFQLTFCGDINREMERLLDLYRCIFRYLGRALSVQANHRCHKASGPNGHRKTKQWRGHASHAGLNAFTAQAGSYT